MTAKDPMGQLFAGLSAALDRIYAEAERQRLERFNHPDAVARRKARSRKGWETRRARQAEEQREQDILDSLPWTRENRCPGMDIQPATGSEVYCWQSDRHDGDCDDGTGHTWSSE
ncbi:hypothetical protein ACWD25_17650 [Streptomyces sp. NPDC002920]